MQKHMKVSQWYLLQYLRRLHETVRLPLRLNLPSEQHAVIHTTGNQCQKIMTQYTDISMYFGHSVKINCFD